MKTHFLKPHGILLIVLLALQSIAFAQNNTKDEKAIQEQVGAFFNSWNKHDFSDTKNYFAKDADFVNIVGMHWKGVENIRYAHQTYHETSFKDIPLEKREVTVRFVNPTVAIAHILMHRSKAITTPDGSIAPPSSALATATFVKTNGVWLIEAFANVVVDEKAVPFNPVTMRDEKTTN